MSTCVFIFFNFTFNLLGKISTNTVCSLVEISHYLFDRYHNLNQILLKFGIANVKGLINRFYYKLMYIIDFLSTKNCFYCVVSSSFLFAME